MAWDDKRTAQLVELAAGADPVTTEAVASIAETMEASTRSISSKLRKMEYNVEKASAKARTFSDEQEAELVSFLNEHNGTFTYNEIAERIFGGEFSAKQVQGKILSLELTANVKPTPKAVSTKTYSDDEEATIVTMVNDGAFLEAIASALGRELNSVRGKALSMLRSEAISVFPKQETSHAKVQTDALADLGDISEMTVEAIAEAIGKTPRGVKVMLTRRELACADYKGKKKAS